MLCEFFLLSAWNARDEYCRVAGAWGGLLVFVGHAVFRAYLKYALSQFYREFYDLVGSGVADFADFASGDTDSASGSEFYMAERRAQVFALLLQFAWIVAPAVVVHPVSKWIAAQWRFEWRLALVDAYLTHWNVTEPGVEGAAQRVHEDTSRFENGLYTCFAVMLDSLLTLVVFVPILIELGGKAMPEGVNFDGWLVCLAVGAALGGLCISMTVGYRLVALEVANQIAEGQFRTKLVHLQDTPHTVVGRLPNLENTNDLNAVLAATWGSDNTKSDPPPPPPPPPRPRALSPRGFFDAVLGELRSNYMRLFLNFAAFNTWISLFDQALVVVPYMLVAPLIFASDPARRITLGTLTQTTNAFDKVFGSLAVVSESWASVNDFRSTVYRLHEFENSLYARTRRKGRARYRDLDAEVASVAGVAAVSMEMVAADPF